VKSVAKTGLYNFSKSTGGQPMKTIKFSGLFLFIILAGLLAAQTSYADKSAVAISAPETAAKGSEVVVKLTITHSANNFFHYTNGVYLKVNGKEFSRWDFSSGNRPEEATFVREVKILVNEPIELIAEANCNVHGSKGPAKWKIAIKD
jgi:desulfoferrodoxin (superoxide reductase-like protein)